MDDRFDDDSSNQAPPLEGSGGARSVPVWWLLVVLGALAVGMAAAFLTGRWTAPEREPQAFPVPVVTVPVTTSSTTTSTTSSTTTTTTTTTLPPTTTLALPPEPVARIAAQVGPAVVQIRSSIGVGAGVIYDEEGLILTAAHVLEDDTEVEVTLADGRRLEGEVLGAHEATDVAVIEVELPEGVSVAELALGAELRVGQLAVALGSPFGLDQTVTSGIVSAVDRVVDGVSMVQTDAAINPGNSGGPLVDLAGRVIGINDQIFTSSGTNSGVGFAISIDLAAMVADQIVAGEEVRLAFLGVSVTQGMPDTPGALVDSVVAGSAAEEAGIEVGDLIVSVDGEPISGAGPLRVAIIERPPGSEVVLEVIRGGRRLTVSAELGSGG